MSGASLPVDERADGERIGWGGVWPSAVLCGSCPGGLKGRGALAFSLVVRAGTIRAGDAESADIPHSDRERVEGFRRLLSSAVDQTAIVEFESVCTVDRT